MDKLEVAKLVYLKAWRLDRSIRAVPKPTDAAQAVRWAREVERSKERVKRTLERVAEVAEEGAINGN
jgi:hypothetical protein